MQAGIASSVTWDGSEVVGDGEQTGFPAALVNDYMTSFEFDGWLTEWKDMGRRLKRLGMKKFGDRLPWLLEATLFNGKTWRIYVDSHTGDAFRVALIDSSNRETTVIEYSDYRDVAGYRLPHRVDYYDEDRILVTDRFDLIEVEVHEEGSSAEQIVAPGEGS